MFKLVYSRISKIKFKGVKMSFSKDEMSSTPYGLLLQNQTHALESANNMFGEKSLIFL